MTYKQIEKQLIASAMRWRESPDYKSTIGFDNTPFTQFETFKARAIWKNKAWYFRAYIRQGYYGKDCLTLEESFNHALKEQKERRDEWEKENEAEQ